MNRNLKGLWHIYKANNFFIILVLLISIFVMFFRELSFFLEPRFWAEEGSLFFSSAYNLPWYKALFKIQRGYFSLWPNLSSTIAANFVPLKHAPLVTTLFALAVQIIPVTIILWSKSNFLWQGPVKRVLGVLIIVFAPLSNEIWLNTIGSQFYFLLITFLILNEDVDLGHARIWWHRILLVLSGMTGIASCLLTPLFALKAIIIKRRENYVQAGILATCSILQICLLWKFLDRNATQVRFSGIDLPTLVSIIWTQSISLTLFGWKSAWAFFSIIKACHADIHAFELVGYLLLFSEALFFLYVSSNLGFQRRLMLLGSYFLILIPSILSSAVRNKFFLIVPSDSSRYFYVPNIILMFLFLSNIQFGRDTLSRIRGAGFAILLAVSITLGVTQYKNIYYNSNWPKWKEEILKWEGNYNYPLKIWPPGWKIDLRRPNQ